MRRSMITMLVASALLLPGLVQAACREHGFDQVAFTKGDAYVFAIWVAFEGETASSLFDYLLNPLTLQMQYGDYFERDFEHVERDGFVEGVGSHPGFRWTIAYHDIPGEVWVIPAEGKVYRVIILDQKLGKTGRSQDVYVDLLKAAIAADGLPDPPDGFTVVEEDPDCAIGQPHPFCPFRDASASA